MQPRLIILLAVFAAVTFAGLFSRLALPTEDPSGAVWQLCVYYGLPFAGAWAALCWLAWRLPKHDTQANFWRRGAVVVGVGLAVRLFVVFAAGPQLSDDLWRYVQDGSVLAAGENPYAQSPAERPSPVSTLVNHNELVTIYQPVSQWTFAALSGARSLWPTHDPLGDWTFRLGFVLADLLVIVLLLCKLRGDGRSAWWAALYAWHPLPISEVAGSGHQEPIGIALLLATLLLVDRRSRGAMLLAGATFAGAVAVKPVVLPLALPLMWMHRRQVGHLLAAGGGAIVAGLVLYLPFLVMPGGMARHVETITTFMGHWRFNGSLHPLVEWATASKTAADVTMAVMLIGVLLAAMRLKLDAWRVTGLYLFAALLLSSTVYPWYLLWALAIVPIRFSAAVWVWSVTIALSYLVLRDPAAWELPLWAQVAQYAAVTVALCYDLGALRRTKSRDLI